MRTMPCKSEGERGVSRLHHREQPTVLDATAENITNIKSQGSLASTVFVIAFTTRDSIDI